MDKAIENYIRSQPVDRQFVLSDIHSIILENDKSVISEIGSMMGKEMIIYRCNGMMKYALSGVSKYMSLHMMPMYASPPLFKKFQSALSNATFRKGCINFESAEKMPLDIVRQLIIECSQVDLAKIRREYAKAKQLKSKGVKPPASERDADLNGG